MTRRLSIMKRKSLTNKAGDVRPLTREDFKHARLLREVDPEFIKNFHKAKKARGRPAGRSKAVVSMSIDKDILAALRASGQGWQSRVNALLRVAVDLNQHV